MGEPDDISAEEQAYWEGVADATDCVAACKGIRTPRVTVPRLIAAARNLRRAFNAYTEVRGMPTEDPAAQPVMIHAGCVAAILADIEPESGNGASNGQPAAP